MIAHQWSIDYKDAIKRKLNQPYKLHQEVYRLFEHNPKAGLDRHHGHGLLYANLGASLVANTYGTKIPQQRILLLSQRQPQVKNIDQLQSKEVPTQFLQHRYYRFQVLVNPVRRCNSSRNLLPVCGAELISDWFADRATASWGFSVDPQRLQLANLTAIIIEKNKGEKPITINSASITGQLKVLDHAAFCQSFQYGIGRAKAFGFGLLQLQPLG